MSSNMPHYRIKEYPDRIRVFRKKRFLFFTWWSMLMETRWHGITWGIGFDSVEEAQGYINRLIQENIHA